MKDFFELREAYRKPTAAEIAADKAKERRASGNKGPDSTARYKNIKKKVYGNMMGGLKKEESELTEGPDLMKMSKELLKHKSKGVNYEKAAAYVRAIHNNSNINVQDKAMKGLLDLLKNMDLTDRTTITKILKDNGFKVKGGRIMRESVLEESTDNYRKSIDRIQAKKTRDSLTPSEKDKLAKLHALMKRQRKTGNYKMESADLEEKYAVKYTHPTDKKSGKTTGPMSKSAADKKAAMGNKVDKVGGKYTVIRHVEEVAEAKLSAMGIHNKIADRNLLTKAIKTAEKMGGNMTGAVREIEKMKKGLSKHKAVQAALRQANESVSSADKKPENYRDPETGKMKVRMVAVDRDISSKKTNESVELEERTNSVKYSRKDFENTKKGDKLEIKWGDSISSGRSATFVVAGKSASKKYNVEKLRLEPEGKKGGVKFFLRSRNGGDATFSIGDMAAIMTSIKKV